MLVLDVIDQALPIAQAKNIQLEHELEDDEAMVSADQPLLTRALFNLLENAIKYSPRETHVSLHVRCVDGWLVCDVVDQGKGIGAEELPDLFSQYRRFSSAHGVDGIGLGLSMVKAVVDRHGGQIECRSVVGKGTTFSLRLQRLS
jgi:signal transduction histidine kinase